jgi:purine nucleosidase/pyrimidine-specific ribonucleoside hydrolase
MPARKQRVIIDTDPGVDDALAILLALRSPELEVVAITTVCGNVRVEQATRNLFRVLELVPFPSGLLVGQGAVQPLQQPLELATHVHGADGLGELDRIRNPDGKPRYVDAGTPRSLPNALTVWKECLRRYPGEVTLITLGPLTNLAQALEADPAMVRTFRSVICMGGAIGVPGNVTPAAEYNIYVDPHAAERVMRSGLPVTLVPLDVTTRVSLTRETIAKLTANTTDPVCRFLSDATGPALDFAQRAEGRGVFHLHDPLAVGVALDPSLVKRVPLRLTVETEDRAARGKTVADRRLPATIQASMEVDAVRFLTLFRSRLCGR